MPDSTMMELAAPGTQPEYHFPPYVSTIARSPRYAADFASHRPRWSETGRCLGRD